MSARVKLPDTLANLLRSELERAIHESALSSDEALIATRYIIQKVPQIDIAAELGYERSTISKKVRYILEHVSHTSHRLYE